MHKKLETTPQNSMEFFRMVQVLKEQAKNKKFLCPLRNDDTQLNQIIADNNYITCPIILQ